MKGSGYPSENILKIVANGKFVKGIPRPFLNEAPLFQETKIPRHLPTGRRDLDFVC